MKTILVTGGIASGKSTVCARLKRLGWPVYDSDSRTKALYDSVPGLRERVERAIGRPFSEIGIIFEDERARAALEAVVYPDVLRDFLAWRESLPKSLPAVVFESAVALDKPQFDGLFDEVWLVTAPLEQRLARNPKSAQRLAAQPEIDPARVQRILCNDRSPRTLQRRTDALVQAFLQENTNKDEI